MSKISEAADETEENGRDEPEHWPANVSEYGE